MGPLYGQYTSNHYGYKHMYDILSITNLVFVCTYFCCVILREAFYVSNSTEREKRITDLEESINSSDINVCDSCSNSVIQTNDEIDSLIDRNENDITFYPHIKITNCEQL